MFISRFGAPEIDTVPTPSMRASGLAMLLSSILYSAGMLSLALAESIMIGIMSAENLKMIGVLISSGNADDIMSSLSRTSFVKSSMSYPYSNSSVMIEMFSREFDVMCLRCSTEFSVFSSGRVTLFSMSDALAPE